MSKPFVYTSSDGSKTVTLPPASEVNAGVLRRVRKMPEVDMLFTILETVCSDEAISGVDSLSITDLNDMFVDWFKAAGVQLPQA